MMFSGVIPVLHFMSTSDSSSAIIRVPNYLYTVYILRISGPRDWWTNMKKIMGLNGNPNSDMEELAKKTTDGDFAEQATVMHDLFSVCE